MSKGKPKKNILITIAYIVLVATLPITLLFSNFVGSSLNEHIQHTIENSAAQCADIIERQYQSDMLLLEGLAMRMSASMLDAPQEGIQRMVSTAERYGMKRIGFSTADGVTLTTDGVELDLTGVDNFERAMAGEMLLTSVIKDEADGKDVNIYSVPVYHEETKEIIGVLSAVYNSDMFEELLSAETFDGEGYTYIIDSAGNVVINSKHHNAIPGLQNVFEHMSKYTQNKEDITGVQYNMRKGNTTFFEIYGESGGRFAVCMPMGVNDWYVLSVVPKAVAEQTKNMVMYSVLIYCMCMMLGAIYVVLSIRNSQKEKNRLLTKALYEDELTGGRTYAKFCIDCRERLNWRFERRAACAFFNIDNFNLVATLYGNEESEKIIKDIFEIIKNSVGDKGIVARNGTNQFVMMFFFNELEEMRQSIVRFNTLFYKNAKFENVLRPSLGVYLIEDWDESIDVMVNKARIAYETIKQNGDKHVVYYDESFRNAMYEDKHFEKEMEAALDKQEFVPYLQPKYDAETGQICGAEALIRWITPEGTIISPGKFIPLAENNGFIRQLDRAMFSMVCHLQRYFVDKGITPVPISVNVSRQLMYDKTFADDYYNLIRELGLSTDMVELEITESAFFEDLALFRSTLEKLRSYGFKILMDDFGTGYSSLQMLKSVPIDQIKLDKTFVDDYNDEKGSSIITCVLDLAKMLKLPVVAEGVETENQYRYLRELGCNVIQGYYFAKPMPAVEYIKKVV